MQTILGAGGAIGVELAKALPQYTKQIRLVGRNPKSVNTTDELFKADLTNRDQVMKAVEGSEVVYLTVGIDYNTKLWQDTWPKIMRTVIDACKKHHAKLVFFDNIYMYDPESIPFMTEENPIQPSSKKGKVRAEIAQMVLDEIKNGSLTALIARSADFYGLGTDKSVLQETVFKNLKAGKAANLLITDKKMHNYTFTKDAGIATAMLGNTTDAFNQVWHLPSSEALTGKQWVELFAKELGVQPKIMTAPKFMVAILGLFMPIMKEIYEMLYQYDRDYVFDSSKFQKRFNFKPVTAQEGVKMIVKEG